jgi:hypothetical protein
MTPATATRRPPDAHDPQRTAFRELHATRLHGFALLLLLGDRRIAARLTEAALDDATSRLDELRHPERAAAWLRHRVLRSAGGRRSRLRPQERLAALDPLRIDASVLAGLQALRLRERAALIAASIERFDDLDVGVVVGQQGQRLHDLLRRSRIRYLAAAASVMPDASDGSLAGPTAEKVRAVAARAMT